MSLSAQSERYNADGYLAVSKLTDDRTQSYMQIFRDGSLEYGDSYALDGAGGGDIRAKMLEEQIRQIFGAGRLLTRTLEAPVPVHVLSITHIWDGEEGNEGGSASR